MSCGIPHTPPLVLTWVHTQSGVVVLQRRWRRRRQVEQAAVAQREGVDELELDLGDVRCALPGLDRGPQLLVVRGALADVDDVRP